MTVNLLNPACAPCNDCDACAFCTDFLSPNQWYARYCGVQNKATGYANRVTPFPYSYSYFWGPHSFPADLMGILINWTFDPSDLFYSSPTVRHYKSTVMSLPSLSFSIDYYKGAPGDPEGSYVPTSVSFSDFDVYIATREVCGMLRYIMYATYSTSLSSTRRSIQSESVEYWDPLTPCGETMEGTVGAASQDFNDSGPNPYFVAPIDFVHSGAVSGVVAVNNSMLVCP